MQTFFSPQIKCVFCAQLEVKYCSNQAQFEPKKRFLSLSTRKFSYFRTRGRLIDSQIYIVTNQVGRLSRLITIENDAFSPSNEKPLMSRSRTILLPTLVPLKCYWNALLEKYFEHFESNNTYRSYHKLRHPLRSFAFLS